MLTYFLINFDYNFFASGWVQFAAAFGFAFFIMILLGRLFINYMKKWQKKGQPISENVPDSHKIKSGTPTMGGILIIFAIITSSLVFMDWFSGAAWIAILSLLMFATIGFLDDYKKVKSGSKKAANGLSARARLIAGGVFVVILAYLINLTMPAYIPEYSLSVPFFGLVPLGLFYYLFGYFVITGSANATNITDGLDGMLSKLYLPVLIVLVVALYSATRIGFIDTVIFLPQASGLYPVLGAVFGAVLGFLWYNCRPAQIFMGDVGSLALGGFMGTVSMLLKSEIVMGISAFMIVLILLSSFIQTIFFKITKRITGTGKRVFKMAPLHHHFELCGVPESKIVERFFIISILFSGIALIILKFA